MKHIAVAEGSKAPAGSLRKQILDAISIASHGGISWIEPGRENAEQLSVSLNPRVSADVLLAFDTADRGVYQQTGPNKALLINSFKALLVPGRWHKERLLADKRVSLPPQAIIPVGSPRFDALRALQAEREPSKDGSGRVKVLFAPLHGNWSDSIGQMSVHDALDPYLPQLHAACDLTVARDPRNLRDKVPLDDALLEADILITDYTSLIYEAWAMGKPVIFPRWLTGDRILRKAAESAEAHIYREYIGHHANDMAELLALVEQGRALDLGAGVDEFMTEFAENFRRDRGLSRTAEVLIDLTDPFSVLFFRERMDEARLAVVEKDYAAAEYILCRLLEHNPRDLEIFRLLLVVSKALKKSEQEGFVLDQVMALEGASAGLLERRAEIHEQLGQYESAIEVLVSAIAMQPAPKGQSYYRLALLLDGLGHRPDGCPWTAEMAYAEAGRLLPKTNFHILGLGALHAAAERWNLAADAFAKSVTAMPLDATLRYHYGVSLSRCLKWKDAEVQFRAAIALGSSAADRYFNLGLALERQGLLQEAADAYLCACQSKKVRAEWRYRAGFVLDALGRHSEAIQAFDKEADKSTGLAPFQKSIDELRIALFEEAAASPGCDQDVLSQYGLILEQQGRTDAAAEVFSRAIVSARVPGADLFQRHGQLQATLSERRLLEDRLSRDCSTEQDWILLAALCTRSGDTLGAIEALRQAVGRSQEHREDLYLDLARAFTRVGQAERACEAYRYARLLQRPHLQETGGKRFEKDSDLRRNAIYREFHDVLPIQSTTILYESFGGEGISDNPLAIFRKVDGDPRFKGWNHVWVIDNFDKIPADLRARRDVFFVTKETTLYMRYLATARYLINNATFPSYFVRREGQDFLATWHGTPLKTLGYDIASTPLQRANTARNLIQASFFIAPNKHTEHVMLERYGVKELFTGTSLMSGYPRIDMLVNAGAAEKQRIVDLLDLDPTKPIVLFAPTYRGHWATPEIETNALIETLERLKSDKYNLVFRGHYFAEEALMKLDLPVKVAPHAIDSCQLLSVVDVLISDYSSIFYDFLITSRPIIHYIYDWDYYVEHRGVYFGKSDLPGIVCEDEASLLEAVEACIAHPQRQITPVYTRNRELYCLHEDGRASERVVEALFFGNITCRSDFSPSEGARILVHGGDLQADGRTRTMQAAVRALHDAGAVMVTMIDRRAIINNEDRIRTSQGMIDYTDVLVRFGGICYSLEEAWISSLSSAQNGFISLEHEQAFDAALRHEVRRLLGRATFDVVIDMDGTRPFWTQLLAMVDANHHVLHLDEKFPEALASALPHLRRNLPWLSRFDRVVCDSSHLADSNSRTLSALQCDVAVAAAPPLIDVAEILRLAERAPEGDNYALFDADERIKLVNQQPLDEAGDHGTLIDALEILIANGQDAALYLLGEGDRRVPLIADAASRGLASRVHLIGPVENPYPYLKDADCAIYASSASGVSLIEAGVVGSRVVSATPVASGDDADSRWAVVVEGGAKGLAAAIGSVLDAPSAAPSFNPASYVSAALEGVLTQVGGKQGLTSHVAGRQGEALGARISTDTGFMKTISQRISAWKH